ncbi:unnamed protein product [Mytilus edulis]|uniref:Endonuclease n=1 Tax=Mytilus edulis TaxID=6550 RepID=A0A8S3QM12_MYTED|nr:unnamed protein product [Mytilus edulis]
MDDSGEVIIAINHSFQEENDGEITIPLNEQKVDSVDYAEQTISHDKEQNLFMNELRNLKSLFHNQLGEITHEFSNCQKEVIIAVNQIKRDFQEEISCIKDRISKIEDAVYENKRNISTNYKMIEQNKDLVNHNNHMSDIVNTENKSKGDGQAVPDEANQTSQNTEKQQQNTDDIYSFNKDKMYNINQNYAVLDRPKVPRLTNSHTHLPKSRKPVEVGLRGRSQAGTEWPKSIKINESLANNEGLFVRAKINNKCLAFLVDTGANVTILSKKFINEINPSLLPIINPVNINLITATGDSTPFIGQIDVEICLGNYIYHHNVLVADISNEGIIGMDFLVTHDCDVLLSQNKLKIKGEIIQCYHYASSAKSCYRVAIQETVDVPPNSEMIVSGESDEPIFRGLAGLIEPNEKFVEKNGLLVARSIVHPEMYNIPLRIINMNKEPCTLYKGTIIATCNKVDEEDIQTSEFVNSVAGGQAIVNKGRQLPDYLHEVFESNQANLDKDQKEKFRDLLIEYSDIFSKSSEDIGLTDLVEHTINTGNNPPVRQRPRRIPLARMKDAEAEIQKMVKQDIIEPSTSPWELQYSSREEVTEKNQKFVWTEECQQSFEELKTTLISAPILAYPTREDLFILDTDASNVGMGAVLSQLQDGVEKVICYFSKTFSRSERKYCVTRRELLAVVASIKHFHHYLYGKYFKVRSDHGALSWLFNFKNPEGQLARWFEVLASYDFKIEHRAGRSHNNADALSRRPCYNKECPHCARAEINYELVPTHKNVLTVEKCNDNVTIRESCRNVQDVSVKQSVTTTSISCKNEDWPNMTSDETCHKVKSHVIHNEFRSKGPDINPDVLPVQSEIVRVCTRSKDYGCSQNEKDDPVKEINFENVSESQLSDDVISIIIQWKIDEVKPIWADVSHMSPEVKFYWSRLNSLILVNGILYRKWESYNGKHYDLHIVLPANFKRFVLNQVHNTVTGGHLGVRKTLSKIKQRYFWYKMRQDVKFWCTKCDICASKKAPCKKPKAPMKQYLVGAPWERMAIDILGPLPISVNNNRYLMVVQDYFSKWTEAIPIPDTEAVTVAKKFVERIVTIFGVPLSIHSDQGSNFESNVFKEMCIILGIHKTRTTPFRPKSDGMVEKSNSTIETMLSAFVSKHQRDWDEYIYLLMLAYRSSEHESLGTSPCSMLFGREVNLPVDLILGRPETEKSPLHLKTVYAYELSQKLEVIHKLKLSSDRMKRNYDVGTKMQTFDVGDPVWLHNPRRVKGLCPKLQNNWEGPYIVVNKLNDVIYRIQKGPKMKPKVVHQDRLKPYLGENVPVWFN